MRLGSAGSVSTLARSRLMCTSRVLVSPNVVAAPHPVDEHLAGEHPAGVLQQQRQQLELLERQADRSPRSAPRGFPGPGTRRRSRTFAWHGASRHVERRPPQHRADPRHELAQPVRLGHVVVRADFEPDHGVDLGTLCGHHDDRHLGRGPQLAGRHRCRTASGSITSSSTRSGLTRVEQLERLHAVERHLDPETLPLEPDGQRLDEGLLVLDDQYGGVASVITVLVASCVAVSVLDGFGPVGSRDAEGRAFALAGAHGDLTVVVAGDVADDGEAQPVPPVRGCGPGPHGRNVRTPVRGRGRGCRCRWSSTSRVTKAPIASGPQLDHCPRRST